MTSDQKANCLLKQLMARVIGKAGFEMQAKFRGDSIAIYDTLAKNEIRTTSNMTSFSTLFGKDTTAVIQEIFQRLNLYDVYSTSAFSTWLGNLNTEIMDTLQKQLGPAHEFIIRFNLQHIYRLFNTPSKLPIQKMEAQLVLLYSRLPSQAHGYKIDENMISRVVAARGMLDSWLAKLQMNIRHLEGYRSHLIEGERAGLWDKEVSQLAEKLLTEEREILHQVASITRIVTRYLTIFQGRNDLMMADNEPPTED